MIIFLFIMLAFNMAYIAIIMLRLITYYARKRNYRRFLVDKNTWWAAKTGNDDWWLNALMDLANDRTISISELKAFANNKDR